jgi:hypothetical protein
MDLDQNALIPTALVWDRNGELCSQEFHRLLTQLQPQELGKHNQDETPGSS